MKLFQRMADTETTQRPPHRKRPVCVLPAWISGWSRGTTRKRLLLHKNALSVPIGTQIWTHHSMMPFCSIVRGSDLGKLQSHGTRSATCVLFACQMWGTQISWISEPSKNPFTAYVTPIAAQSRHRTAVGVSCHIVHGAALAFLEAKTRRFQTRFSANRHVLCRSKQSAKALPMGDWVSQFNPVIKPLVQPSHVVSTSVK